MDGLLIIDKPTGCTSHDVVAAVRRLTGERKAGHGGTLDPDATGVLIVGLGRATRFFPFLSRLDKSYSGTIRLGFATDTYDASGQPLAGVSGDPPGWEALNEAGRRFVGEIMQTPPAYSAKKINGRPAYRLARAGGQPVLEPVRVTIRRFSLFDYRPPLVDFEVECSTGTYIRSLAHDLGLALGCGAHLAGLRRTSVGAFSLEQAVTMPELAGMSGTPGRIEEHLIALKDMLPCVPDVFLTAEAAARISHGAAVQASESGPWARSGCDIEVLKIFSPDGTLIALAGYSAADRKLSPFLVLD